MTVPFARLISGFDVPGEVVAAEPVAGGYINDSYRVTLAAVDVRSVWLLQRINPTVFADADLVMTNIFRVTRHLAARLRKDGAEDWQERTLTVIPTRSGENCLRAEDGAAWRVFRFIEGSTVTSGVATPEVAHEAARAFGEFLRLLSDYDGPALFPTIRGFHDTAARFGQLTRAINADTAGRRVRVRSEIRLALEHQEVATVLPRLAGDAVPERIAHNDAKVANVLLDRVTGRARCVVDLDTVMPGSALHDFGDLIRSTVSPATEDETDLQRVEVRLPWFEALVDGYLTEAGDVLTRDERRLLVFAGRLIALEQGVRFLTDFLDGDRYYRTTRPDQNLDRARTQFRLYELLTARAPELEAMVG